MQVKAFMRRHFIQYNSKLKKEEKIQAILDEIKMKEELKKSTEKKIILHQWQLPPLIVIEMVVNMTYMKQKILDVQISQGNFGHKN